MSRRNFEAVVMDTVYAVIHVEYVFIAHILIYILHKYWMRNSISPFYDVCNCFIICHLIITLILAAELNYRFTNSKTSLAIVIQYSLQEEESRNVSSKLVHKNHKVLDIYTHWQTHWHTYTLPHQQSDGNYWALMLWKDDGNTLTVAHTAHVTWVRHHVTHHTLLHHLSLRWLARLILPIFLWLK